MKNTVDWRVKVMVINGHTKTLGLIGNPVEHTYSPLIHMSLAEFFQDNYAYLPFRVEKGALEAAVAGAYALGMAGLNVTVPYKQEVMPYLIGVDEDAAKAGAVNTLVREGNGYKGYNTDIPGLYRAMCADHVEIKGREVLLIGAGGAARAAAYMLLKYGAGRIVILNRTRERAGELAEELNREKGQALAEGMSFDQVSELDGHKRFLAIQATSVGMAPKVDETVITQESFYEKLDTAYDLIFNPTETLFLKKARQAGAQTYNGGKMLLYQGITAYELWTGHTVSGEVMELVYEKLDAAMKGAG
jgi:shikimate dehydrogenase